MQNFWGGFNKQAEEESGYKKYLAPVAAAGTAGLGAYGLLRRGGKGPLTRILEGKRPGALKRFGHRLVYGADNIEYVAKGATIPSKAKKIKGTVLHAERDEFKFFRGDKNPAYNPKMKESRLDDKLVESRMLNKAAPSFHTPTRSGKVTGKGKKNLAALHRKMAPHGGYIIKARSGANTGVGNVALVHSDDIGRYLKTGVAPRGKSKLLNSYLKNPETFIAQKAINIKKSITGASSEIRVHAINGKVIKGATMPRGANIDDSLLHGRKAERALQTAIDKMPAHERKNVMFAADVAITKDKTPKIIELNRGMASSGLLDPVHILKQNRQNGRNPISSMAAAAGATKANHAVYKHLTGRDSALVGGAKAIGVGGIAGAGTYAAQRHMEKKAPAVTPMPFPRPMPSPAPMPARMPA